jgi:hypothetical protein
MYTLPAAPPPVASVAADSVAALQRAGPAGALVPGEDDWDGVGDVGVVEGLAELVPGVVVLWACGPSQPHPLSISAAAAAAVVKTNIRDIR